MKIARYRSMDGAERLGIVSRASGLELLVDVAKAAAVRGGAATPGSVMGLIEGGAAAMDATRELLAWAETRQDPLWIDDPDTVDWLTPVPEKSMFCAGRNFGRHLLESKQGNSASKLHSDFPTGFIKLGRTLVPHKSQVKRPADVQSLDYEVEIALVLGKAIDAQSDIDPASAIFGYTIFNDLSARECQLREMQNGMIMLGKNYPGFGPIGPYILTADEVPDPTALVLWLKVNGELRQQSDCRDLIFDFPHLVAFWSRFGLVPGDLISTGTPEGVALHHKPDPQAWYLKPGDYVEAGVQGIGVLETFIV
ncbi:MULTISPECIES: fumarylacetoacetate hydrolase family protein [unclassified Pseudomonas]|uniref:fumarylacetoacetate hydrolase family protein n=1 Tax=unclassified Pseudomonas TaxID=196821 RepID=UPI0021C86EBD|nr:MULTISPECIES: fumarylacetoacetate hydrolase family protein [unclassified Pseudomonas]MCU1734239.1 fumarylacetoacetate hydrolase family protein [Pseudomonas sp. 20P_3.2_Bac4]MCU1743114.1 fumarylacetoacetate hydrolase family protein [Pseudomonas sp. 20P_3.2_Bac5]